MFRISVSDRIPTLHSLLSKVSDPVREKGTHEITAAFFSHFLDSNHSVILTKHAQSLLQETLIDLNSENREEITSIETLCQYVWKNVEVSLKRDKIDLSHIVELEINIHLTQQSSIMYRSQIYW